MYSHVQEEKYGTHTLYTGASNIDEVKLSAWGPTSLVPYIQIKKSIMGMTDRNISLRSKLLKGHVKATVYARQPFILKTPPICTSPFKNHVRGILHISSFINFLHLLCDKVRNYGTFQSWGSTITFQDSLLKLPSGEITKDPAPEFEVCIGLVVIYMWLLCIGIRIHCRFQKASW